MYTVPSKATCMCIWGGSNTGQHWEYVTKLYIVSVKHYGNVMPLSLQYTGSIVTAKGPEHFTKYTLIRSNNLKIVSVTNQLSFHCMQ